MTEILRIQNPRAFLMPDFRDFILKALATAKFTDADNALMEIAAIANHPNFGIFVTREDNQYVGLGIYENNTSALSIGCLALHFFNRGTAKSRNLLIRALIDFARDGGHRRILGTDMNLRPQAFARLFSAVGKPELRGNLYEFELKD